MSNFCKIEQTEGSIARDIAQSLKRAIRPEKIGGYGHERLH